MDKYKGYDKITLTRDYLMINNDDFFEKYKFNYVPESRYKDMIYKELSDKILKERYKIS